MMNGMAWNIIFSLLLFSTICSHNAIAKGTVMTVTTDSLQESAPTARVVPDERVELENHALDRDPLSIGELETDDRSYRFIRDKISQYAVRGGAEFRDINGYQFKALSRTQNVNQISTMSDAKIVQYYALYCIYEATSGINNDLTNRDPRFENRQVNSWTNTDNWESTIVDPCNGWYGVICNNNDQVVEINLNSNFLTGNFPYEIVLLSTDPAYSIGAGVLNALDLSNNEHLSNNGDSSWMSRLGPSFQYLYFQQTGFGGFLPRMPSNLVELDGSWTLVNGGLTSSNFAGLNQLEYVKLNGNAFNTSVPAAFGQLESLQYLYLSDSFISGDLSYLNGMPSLIEHWIDSNPDLTGTIPASIGDIDTLESLSISNNALMGEIPAEIGNLKKVTQFWAYGNQLSGELPKNLGKMKRLHTMHLEGNQFEGKMPDDVCKKLSALEVLGADCHTDQFFCDCCTCCGLSECNPQQ